MKVDWAEVVGRMMRNGTKEHEAWAQVARPAFKKQYIADMAPKAVNRADKAVKNIGQDNFLGKLFN